MTKYAQARKVVVPAGYDVFCADCGKPGRAPSFNGKPDGWYRSWDGKTFICKGCRREQFYSLPGNRREPQL